MRSCKPDPREIEFSFRTLSVLLRHHPAATNPSARSHFFSVCLQERKTKLHQNEQGLPPSPVRLEEKAIYESCPPVPMGTCRQSITTDGQHVWSLSVFPHIKLSPCQMSCHRIWGYKEIAIIFIRCVFFPSDLCIPFILMKNPPR